jgi:hypothetical protein
VSAGIAGATSYNEQKAADKRQEEYLKEMGQWMERPVFQSSGIAEDLMEQLFEGGNGDALIDFLTNRLPLNKAERTHKRFFNRNASPLVNEGISNLKSMYPFAKELLDTGFPTDLEGIISNEQRRFRNETIPSIYESRFAALGEGSGLNSLANTAAADLGSDLGAYSYLRDEAATNRRVQGAPLVQSIYQAPTEFGLRNYGEIGRQGELARIREESTRRGALPPVPSTLSLFPGLASIEQGQVFPVGPYDYGGSGGDTTTAALGALSNMLSNPQFLQQLGGGVSNLYNNYFGGGTGAYLQNNNFTGGSTLYGDTNFGSNLYSGSGYNPGGWSTGGVSGLTDTTVDFDTSGLLY